LDEYIAARIKVADYYDDAFKGQKKITVPFRARNNKHVFHQYTIVLNDVNRDALHVFLADKGIPSMIYYPVPAHRQKMFESFGSGNTKLDVTDWLTKRVISLPMHTELDEEQQLFITSNVLTFINNN
ncbi:MAG: DegT/DnrJ/EryC1/StrS family aminotransferase, partial [Chitinophagaceae bacterium]